MLKQYRWCSFPLIAIVLMPFSTAAEDLREARDAAEVFVYAKEAQNKDLLKYVTTPEQFKQIQDAESRGDVKPRENVYIKKIEITEVGGDRATARAFYNGKHERGSAEQDVHLIRVDGEWRVTTPPEDGGE